jgi:hypothetical protein
MFLKELRFMHAYVTHLDHPKFLAAAKNLEDFLFSDTPLEPSLQANRAIAVATLSWSQIIEQIFRNAVKAAKNSNSPSLVFWQIIDSSFKKLIVWHSQFLCKKDPASNKNAKDEAINKSISYIFTEFTIPKEEEEKARAYFHSFYTQNLQDEYKSKHLIFLFLEDFLDCLVEVGTATKFEKETFNKSMVEQGINQWVSKIRQKNITKEEIDSRRGIWFGNTFAPKNETEIASSLKGMGITENLQNYALAFINQNAINHVGNDYINRLTQDSLANLTDLTFGGKLHSYFLETVDHSQLRLITPIVFYATNDKISSRPIMYRYISISIVDDGDRITIKPGQWFQEIVDKELILQVRKIFYEGGLIKLRQGLPFYELHEGEQQEIIGIIAAEEAGKIQDDVLWKESNESDRLFLKACAERNFALELLFDETLRNKILLGPNPTDLAKIYERSAEATINSNVHMPAPVVPNVQTFKHVGTIRAHLSSLLDKNSGTKTKQILLLLFCHG